MAASCDATTTHVKGKHSKGWQRGWHLGGRVYRALDIELGLFVVKAVQLREESTHDVDAELESLKDLRHPNLVSFLGHDRIGCQLFLHFEYVPGSLPAFLHDFGPMSGRLIRRQMRGILEGLSYLHGRSPPVVHGNLTGANVLIDSSQGCVRLTDFGCSKLDSDLPPLRRLSSLHWTAPEIVKQEDTDRRQADIWGVGCLLIYMATAEKPWGQTASLDSIMLALKGGALCAGGAPPIPLVLSGDLRKMAQNCLKRHPAARPSASDLLEDAVFETEGAPSH